MHVNVCETVKLLWDFYNAVGESWKKLKTSNMFASFIVCSNGNSSALMPDLSSYNSVFVD